MGQKVNPHGLRVGVIKDWDSRWYASKKDFGATLAEDYKLRQTLKKQLYNFGISKIEIERDGKKVKISIHTAKPGLVIGKGGAEIEKQILHFTLYNFFSLHPLINAYFVLGLQSCHKNCSSLFICQNIECGAQFFLYLSTNDSGIVPLESYILDSALSNLYFILKLRFSDKYQLSNLHHSSCAH